MGIKKLCIIVLVYDLYTLKHHKIMKTLLYTFFFLLTSAFALQAQTLVPNLTVPAAFDSNTPYLYDNGNALTAGGSDVTFTYFVTGAGHAANAVVTVATVETPTPTGTSLFTPAPSQITAGGAGTFVGVRTSLEFATPDYLASNTTYTYTITYSGTGLTDVVITFTVPVQAGGTPPPALTATLSAPTGDFTINSATAIAFNYGSLPAGTGNFTFSYTLAATGLTAGQAVTATGTQEPAGGLFTPTPTGFTASATGTVPSADETVTIVFAVPDAIDAPTRYSYSVVYSGAVAGLTNALTIRFTGFVIPPTPALTAALTAPDLGVFTGDGSTGTPYLYTLDALEVGDPAVNLSYTLEATGLTASAAITVAVLDVPALSGGTSPFGTAPAATFNTDALGALPTGASPVNLTFTVPGSVLAPTTYTYTITYDATAAGVTSNVVVQFSATVSPATTSTTATLTAELTAPSGESFTGTGTSADPYLYGLGRVTAGSTNVSLTYALTGTSLTAGAVTVAATELSAPTAATDAFATAPTDFTVAAGGALPSGASPVNLTFTVPATVSAATTYTYTITYTATGVGVTDPVAIRFTARVVDANSPSLTATLDGVGNFTGDGTVGNPYLSNFGPLTAGGEDVELEYSLAGANLVTASPVTVTVVDDPALTGGATSPFGTAPTGFTPTTGGGVPPADEDVTVTFTVPASVASATTYTYTITYASTLTGFTDVLVRFTATVNPEGTVGPLGISDNFSAVATPTLQLSPNPTSGVLFVRGEASAITLLDVSGRVVFSQSVGDSGLDVSDLPAGLYVARITTPSGIITRRLIVR